MLITDSQHLTNDLVQGDDSISKRDDFLELNSEELRKALQIITNNPHISEHQRKYLLANSWKVHYRKRPPTIEEFLTEEFLGPTANSLYPEVRKTLIDYWQPDSEYRNLILASSIGTGKALPVSSPVIIDEIDTIDIELEDGTLLKFDENDKVFYYDDEGIKSIEAKKLNLVKVKDFPVSLNYYYMRIYNVKTIPEFKEAFSIKNYDELIKFFTKFSPDFYKERNIFTNNHHIVPRFEGGIDKKSNLVQIPFHFHIKAHYLRAKEQEEARNLRFAFGNYKSVAYSLGMKTIPKEEKEIFSKIQFVSESLEKRNYFEKITFWVKKDGYPSKKILEEELLDYVNEGWERGRSFNSPANKRWVNEDEQNYYVPKEQFEEYLLNGYSQGMYKTPKMLACIEEKRNASYSTLNTTWMNKDEKPKCVKNEEVEEYLKNGWKKGSLSTTCKGQTWKWQEKDLGRKIFTNGESEVWGDSCPEGYWPGRKTKGKHLFNNGERTVVSDTCPNGFIPGQLTTGKHWYTNEEKEIFTESPPEGYQPGKLATGKHWYTDGIESAQLKECPDGWYRGRVIKK